MRPAFDYGDAVRVIRNLRNDGTFPGRATGVLLIRRGSTGFVREIGTFLQDQIIYSVHFLDADLIVGCREEELIAADAPWTPSRFESREQVAARIPLALRGDILVSPGEVGEVIRVLRDHPSGVAYEVSFRDRPMLQVPESALTEPATAPSPAAENPR
ncbi:nitrogen fixation protein NifZ [Thiocapsa imhoffii]|uniref:Nitrogen fixation protein NifZ n=1 Tax=Thiocapsa imhoffii TaxID=382777 RepID=A0A9X0WG05_9GAMM|nr:nitrogen fixation protein NifZ [Thiocapsa imhoffii]MBK1643977.1 nitrogen fixation protein NifZ [Thiocapsa imhoffii]